MAKRSLAHLMIIIGAALIVIAVLLPTFLVPRLKVIPLDTVSTTVTEVREGALLDSGALAKGEVVDPRKNDPRCKAEGEGEEKPDLPLHCFINDEVPLKSSRHVRVEDPSDEKRVTLEAGTVILREDRDEPRNLINATVDRITLDRTNAFPVEDPISSISGAAPGQEGADEPVQFRRPGIQYQFPFNAEKKSYPYYDAIGLDLFQIDFKGEEEQDGETVYKYSMVVPPQNLYENTKAHATRDGRKLTKADESSLASLRLKFPAEKWGLEGDEDVEMDRYYTTTRTVRVEPTTGVIVNGTEEIFQFYARNEEEAKQMVTEEGRKKEAQERNRTALDFSGQWDADTKKNQMQKAKDSKSKLTIAGTVVPWVLGIVGLVLVLLGIRTHRRS
ncbi:DUF3068 domain-containing protein [Corynebacterium hansenii]|uniref:DUF3068 domain-containing protein n=1 Tax=Corynebacterium hansenii TaxID=394964 RepID=A0ABV7ZQR5_9CORY|nr:DUF3068 domain-containing protein [Corynebacterium hansenii]WJZ01194.1 hypothetical protein CHAN_13055 [Corynebacterium hansenii]